MAPLGILYIATLLKNHGHSVQVFDPWADDDNFIQEIVDFKPDMVGLSFLTTQYRRAKDILSKIREIALSPGSKDPRLPPSACNTKQLVSHCNDRQSLPIFFSGGIHSTALPEEVLNDLALDFVVLGEGEETMREIAEGKNLKNIPGVAYMENGNLIKTAAREPIADLDSLPIPDRSLLNYGKYLIPPGPFRGTYCKHAATIISSRGCPYKCIFCGSSTLMFGFKTRRRSVKNVLNEIDSLYKKYCIDGLYFLDDTFTLSPPWVEEFCESFRTKNFKIKWGCQARVNTVTLKLLKKMKGAGCCQVDYGVESGSDKILKVLKKGTNREMIKKAFRLSHLAGLRPTATFMIGNPEEDKEDIKKTLDLAKEIKPRHVKFLYLTPFPGTEIFDMARKNKWFNPEVSYSNQWSIRQTELPLMEINFTKHELSQIRARLQNKFLLKNYWHYLTNLPFSTRIFMLLLSRPKKLFRSLKEVIRTRRLDNFLEFSLALFRKEKMR